MVNILFQYFYKKMSGVFCFSLLPCLVSKKYFCSSHFIWLNYASDYQNVYLRVLAHLIFLLLSNDLSNNIDASNLTLFANDMSLVASAQIPEEPLKVCQSFMVSFVNWWKSTSFFLKIDKLYFNVNPPVVWSYWVFTSIINWNGTNRDILSKTLNKLFYAILRPKKMLLYALLNIYYSFKLELINNENC